MKNIILTFASTLLIITFTISAQAHDPKEHINKGVKPDCSAMENIDREKNGMEDPVMQAIMKQCMQSIPSDEKPEAHDLNKSEHTGHASDDGSIDNHH